MNIDRILGRTASDVREHSASVASAFLFGLTYCERHELVNESFIEHYVAYRIQVFELDQRPMDVMEAFTAFVKLVVNRDTAPPNPPCLADGKEVKL